MNKNGVSDILELNLSEEEKNSLNNSAEVLKSLRTEIDEVINE